MGDIVDVLAQWRLLLGVTSEVTQEELIFITQFIYDNYKHLTLSDLNLAKTWAIMGKIDVGFVTQKTFSSYYISRSIYAYEDEKRRIINEIDRKRERYLTKVAIENPRKRTSEEDANSFKDHIITLYKSYQNGREFVDIGDMVYNWGKKVGLINPNGKEVQDALMYAQEKLREFKQEEIRLIASKKMDIMDDETRKKKFARVYTIIQMFKRLPLSQIISQIKAEQFVKS